MRSGGRSGEAGPRLGRLWPVLAASALLSSCAPANQSETKAPAAAPAPVEYFRVDPATAGRITGKVNFTGARPARKAIRMDSEEDCRKMHTAAPLDEQVVVNPNKTLANVFVYVKTGLEGKKFPPVETPVKFDQKGCMFVPHVIAVRTGQTVTITNSDSVSHNVHPLPRVNREWNQAQQPGAAPLERKFAAAEVGMPIKCNVHAWMRAYVNVVEHPYFAVTGADGAYELPNLPPGEYTLAAWHERYPAQEQKVTLAASGSAAVEFTFKGE